LDANGLAKERTLLVDCTPYGKNTEALTPFHVARQTIKSVRMGKEGFMLKVVARERGVP
jgi:hypothetical protein